MNKIVIPILLALFLFIPINSYAITAGIDEPQFDKLIQQFREVIDNKKDIEQIKEDLKDIKKRLEEIEKIIFFSKQK